MAYTPEYFESYQEQSCSDGPEVPTIESQEIFRFLKTMRARVKFATAKAELERHKFERLWRGSTGKRRGGSFGYPGDYPNSKNYDEFDDEFNCYDEDW